LTLALLLVCSAITGAGLKAVYLVYDTEDSVVDRTANAAVGAVVAAFDGVVRLGNGLESAGSGWGGQSSATPARPHPVVTAGLPGSPIPVTMAPPPGPSALPPAAPAISLLPAAVAAPPPVATPPVVRIDPAVAVTMVPLPGPSAPPPAAPAISLLPAAVAAPPPVATPPVVRIDPAVVAGLRDRGNELLRSGDIGAARLVFLRAAEAGDVESMVAVGKSFDPALLRRLGVVGFNGDRALAALWYGRASALGDDAAAALLRRLPPG
jgi:hypothetical protein